MFFSYLRGSRYFPFISQQYENQLERLETWHRSSITVIFKSAFTVCSCKCITMQTNRNPQLFVCDAEGICLFQPESLWKQVTFMMQEM